MTHNNLSIFNFKKICNKNNGRNILKNAVTAVASILLFICSCKGLHYLYVKEDSHDRIWQHAYYEMQGKIDNLFVGSSHVYCGVDPSMLNTINGQVNYNRTTGGMKMDTAYYAIQEAVKRNEPDNVYLELYYYIHCGENGNLDDYAIRRSDWFFTDYMNPSLFKVRRRLEIGGIKNGLETWLPFVRFREHLFDYEYVKEVVETKQDDAYRDYTLCYATKEGETVFEVRDNGHEYNISTLAQSSLYADDIMELNDGNRMHPSSEKYLRKIITFCQEEGIGITLFVSPTYELQMISAGDYDCYYRQVKAIAEEYGIAYYDFNLCRTEYLDIQKLDCFFDISHLNAQGTALYTPFLWQVVSSSPEENEKYFHDSYQAKLAAENPQIFGIYNCGFETISEQTRLKRRIASNRETGLEYRITATPDEGTPYTIQDFSQNKDFTLPLGENGTVTIAARAADSPESVQTLEIDY